MANISLSGAKTIAYKATRGTEIIGDGTTALDANKWYEIKEVATSGSTLPIGEVSAVFKTPDADAGTGLIPADGDIVYPLELKRICKTDAEVNVEEGTIDVTDDCENGFNANILDGYKTISGSLNGFMKFDDEKGTLEEGTKEIFGQFFNIVEDDAAGVYTVTPANNEKLLLFVLLNKDAQKDDYQNWLIVPIILNSLGTGAGLKDAQKRDMQWTKAQGYASLYMRKVGQHDLA